MSRAARVVLIALSIVLGVTVGAPARAAADPRPVTLSPGWVNLHGPRVVVGVGAYTIVRRSDQATVGTLVDDRTGARIPVPDPPDCPQSPNLLGSAPGATSLGVYCLNAPQGPTVETYAVPDGPWTAVPVPADCLRYMEDEDMGSCWPESIGRYGISYALDCYHCGTSFSVQRIADGGDPGDTAPATPPTISDLSSPTLTSPLCSSFATSIDGSLIADDGFVLRGHGVHWTLRRCGAAPSLRFDTAYSGPAVLPGLVLWTTRRAIRGLWLPSRRPFVLRRPPNIDVVDDVVLTSDRVYLTAIVNDADPFPGQPRYRTWSAPLPAPPGAPGATRPVVRRSA